MKICLCSQSLPQYRVGGAERQMWEYGSFTRSELETAGAYRIDTEIDSDEPLYPDGGTIFDGLESQQNGRDDYQR